MSSPLTQSAITRAPLGILLRLALMTAILVPLAITFSEGLVEAMLPAYREVFFWAGEEFRLMSLGIDREGADRVLRATVTWKDGIGLGGQMMPSDLQATANASTLIAHALQGPLVAIIATFAWPAAQRWEYAWRGIFLIPLLAALILSDIPCVLAGELWAMATDVLTPGAVSPLVMWKAFLQGGGRYALAIVAAILAVQGGRRVIIITKR